MALVGRSALRNRAALASFGPNPCPWRIVLSNWCVWAGTASFFGFLHFVWLRVHFRRALPKPIMHVSPSQVAKSKATIYLLFRHLFCCSRFGLAVGCHNTDRSSPFTGSRMIARQTTVLRLHLFQVQTLYRWLQRTRFLIFWMMMPSKIFIWAYPRLKILWVFFLLSPTLPSFLHCCIFQVCLIGGQPASKYQIYSQYLLGSIYLFVQ